MTIRARSTKGKRDFKKELFLFTARTLFINEVYCIENEAEREERRSILRNNLPLFNKNYRYYRLLSRNF